MAEPCRLTQQIVQTGSVPSLGLCCFPGENPTLTPLLAALPSGPCVPRGAARILPLPQQLQEGKGGDPQGSPLLVTPRDTRQPKRAILTQCRLPVVRAAGGDTALSCPGVTSKPCPCWGSHQQGPAATSRGWRKDLGSCMGTRVSGWPRPPACAGRVERRWQCQLGQQGGDTGRNKAARRGHSRASGQPSVPHRQCLPGEPLLPLTWPCTIQEGSDSAAPLC